MKKSKLLNDEEVKILLNLKSPSEWISFVSGLIFLLIAAPPVAVVLFGALLWEAMDRCFNGGFTQTGNELTGYIFTRILPALQKYTQSVNSKFVKDSSDAYIISCIICYAIMIPILFSGSAYYINNRGMSLTLATIYHIIRIGPFFQNFALVYTLCHKEGHSYTGFYKGKISNIILRNIFNWWIGLFYGVVPTTFAYGHSFIHHRYNNNEWDVTTTSDKPRDSIVNWIAYVPRYVLYALNVSTTLHFMREKNYRLAKRVVFGTVYFLSWVAIWSILVSPTFAIAFVAFPYFEATLLLAAVNWSWHAFIDPNDPTNEYVSSLTILEGVNNILNEDFHVVHHQSPGAHWTNHPTLSDKLWDEYVKNRASAFQRTHAFEIFALVVARDYEALAEKFVDLKGERDEKYRLTHEDRIQLMKDRLRFCMWGVRSEAYSTAVEKKAR